MKLSLLLSLAGMLTAIAGPCYSQSAKVSLNLTDVSVEKVLNEIEDNSEFYFFVNQRMVDINRKVSIYATNESIREVLSTLFSDENVDFIIFDKQVIIAPKDQVSNLNSAQSRTVSGTVSDVATGEPLPGVNVTVEGTTQGVITNLQGNYSIEIAGSDATLVFSFVGYTTQTVVIGSLTAINVQLVADVKALDEVVVIGYGSVKRKDLTGSIAVVNADDAKSYTASNISDGILGKATGVTVLSTGVPGGVPRIQIRGMGHFGDITPLYVIDGIQTTEQSDFNPNDIETIQILKDASAAALYGSRAANGVVVITTKKGKSGAPKISFLASRGMEQVSKKIPMMNAREFADLNNMAYDNAGLARMPGADSQFDLNIDTDWQDAFIKDGAVQNYDLSYSGGNSQGNYMFSAGYFTQDGIVIGPDYEKYNIRLNTGIIKNRFRVNQTLLYSNSNSSKLYYGFGNPFLDMLRMLPTIPVYDPSVPGGFGIGSEKNKTFGTNPVALQKLNDYNSFTNKVMGNVDAEVDILSGLTYKFNVGFESNNWDTKRYRKRGIESYNRPQPYDEFDEDRGEVYTLLIENTINFNKSFGKHKLGLFTGVSRMITNWEQLGGSVFDFPKPFPVMSAGTRDSKIYGTNAKEGILGYLGRITYDYNGKYLFTFNFRRDGSSKFGPNNKWGNFPGLSAGWRLTEEDFFKVRWINNLKLRGSYGKLGNSDVNGSYNYTSYINSNIAYVLGASQSLSQGAIIQSLANADLRWQSKVLSGIGLDAALFNNCLLFTADYYNSITSDVLVNAPIPWTTGHYGIDPYSNVGKIKNTGFEFSLTYQENKSLFKYDITGNISFVRNEVLKLSDGYEAILSGPTKTTIGQPIGQFFVLRTDGIFQTTEEVNSYVNKDGNPIQPTAKPGDIRYLDVNGRDAVTGELTGNPDGIINLDDREFAGSPWPDFEYGILSNMSYKNWDLNIFLQGSVGGSIFSNTRFVMERMDDNSNYPEWLKPWTETNNSNTTPRALYGAAALNNVFYESDRWMDNASYLRLRSLRIGYTIPVPVFEYVNIFFQAQNLLTLSSYKMWDAVHPGWDAFSRGIDNGTYPNVRSFILGVKFIY